jgi:uncharacterized protein
MNKEQAVILLNNYVKNQNLIRHNLAVGFIMKALARHFQQDETDWEIAGILHDIDWEETKNDPDKHSLKAKEILSQTDLKSEIIQAIYVHNHLHKIAPKTLFEKALYCVEELSGLITAAALVQPDKKLSSVTVESVLKKFKTKSFAGGVNREIILLCNEYLGLSLEELTLISLKAMQDNSESIGL